MFVSVLHESHETWPARSFSCHHVIHISNSSDDRLVHQTLNPLTGSHTNFYKTFDDIWPPLNNLVWPMPNLPSQHSALCDADCVFTASMFSIRWNWCIFSWMTPIPDPHIAKTNKVLQEIWDLPVTLLKPAFDVVIPADHAPTATFWAWYNDKERNIGL